MKTLASIVFLVLVCAGVAYSQPDTTHRARRADSLSSFFVGSFGPFDNWPQPDSADNHFGRMGQTHFRYYNLEDSLGMNAEDRGFWDYPPDHPAPKDTILGGTRGQYLEELIVEPYLLFHALENAYYLRIEFERHTLDSDPGKEYLGFLNRPGLTGTNVKASGASFPGFLAEGGRDTSYNAVQLDTDAAGTFADTLWNSGLFNGPVDSHQYYGSNKISRKMLQRIRVKVNQTVTDTTKILFIATRKELTQTDSTILIHSDTIRVDSRFHHINSDFDNIDIRFLRDTLTMKMNFSFYWPKQVNAIFDYMELMTAHIDTNDLMNNVRLSNTDIGTDGIQSGSFGAYSGEDFISSNPTELNKLIDNIIDSLQGHVNFVRIGDEFPLSQALPFKRLVKLMRERSGGKIEITPFTVDSISWFGAGLPSIQEYSFEGRRKVWVDTNYEDPKMVFYDPYCLSNFIPLPKRTTQTNADSIKKWEDRFLPSGIFEDGSNLSQPKAWNYYSDSTYRLYTQYQAYPYYLGTNRHLRGWVERQNNGSHFGIDWQSGAAPEIQEQIHYVTDTAGKVHKIPTGVYWLNLKSIRPPTGAEMKVTGHLTTSLGGTGLLLYLLSSFPHGGIGPNGGIMMNDGRHNAMYDTTYIINDPTGSHDSVTGIFWQGFEERYDSVRSLIPILIKYGTTILHSKYIGDWTAAELKLAPDSMKAKMPFIDSSVRSQDDFSRLDAYKPTLHLTDTVPLGYPLHLVVADTSNRTFVHISLWLDTTAAAKANHSDTLLYITNMRTDDSYDTTGTPTTIDRRLITMRLKRPHIIMDVMDTSGGQLDNGKIWTPYVGASDPEDSLKLYLLAGDGILIRLMDTLQGTSHQMQYSVNFPKNTSNYVDHGRLQFDRPVPGVKDIHNDWSVPSSHLPYSVGLPDTTHAVVWQDSLLFQKFALIRPEKWRQHHWVKGLGSVSIMNKNLLAPSSSPRSAIISTDSIAHQIVIKTDLEGQSSNGKIKFRDPFLVDSATRNNVLDTLPKGSPFLPQVANPGRMPGADSEHYGGIFLKQNLRHNVTIPIYSVNAFNIIKSGSFQGQDTGTASSGDWVFLHWVSDDDIDTADVAPWVENPMYDLPLINMNKSSEVVFSRDSAQYIARYKAHMAAFIDSYNAGDSGNCCNNQRKLYNMGVDSIGRKMFRFVYSSKGRIYSAVGTRTGTNDGDIIWKPEQLLSSWNNNHSHYPSVGYHPSQAERYHYAYEDDSLLKIKLAMLDTSGVIHAVNISDTDDFTFATPAIASTDFFFSPLDVVAWATANSGIHIRAALWSGGTPTLSTTIPLLGITEHARYPTIWMDSSDYSTGVYAQTHFWIAWQQDTTIVYYATWCDTCHPQHYIYHDSTITDVFAAEFLVYDYIGSPPAFIFMGQTDVSRRLNFFSLQNQRPCLAGFRYSVPGTIWQQVKLAYEAVYSPDSLRHQGIEIANLISGGSWTNTNFLTSLDTTDPYWKPSIEVSKYHKDDTGFVTHDNWYSLVHEDFKGTGIMQWAFDTTATRVSQMIYSGLQDPQIAVTPSKIDSDLYRMALVNTGSEPRSLLSGYKGTFKLAGNDSLWGYHSMTEKDTGSGLMIESGFGELAVDNGNGFSEFDLRSTDNLLKVDSLHSKEFFMQSTVFTLPSGGSFRYCPWIRQSNDSLLKARFGSLKYALDFYDTTGAFKYRLDSMTICDTVPRIHCILRTLSINATSSQKGYAVFHRVTCSMDDTSALPQSIISTAKLSTIENAYKRTSENNPQASGISDITLTTSPNPFKNEVNVYLKIPYPGSVTILAFNALGNSMGYLCQNRMFTNGRHELVWKAGKLPSGIYILRMQYGNEVISTRVVSME